MRYSADLREGKHSRNCSDSQEGLEEEHCKAREVLSHHPKDIAAAGSQGTEPGGHEHGEPNRKGKESHSKGKSSHSTWLCFLPEGWGLCLLPLEGHPVARGGRS